MRASSMVRPARRVRPTRRTLGARVLIATTGAASADAVVRLGGRLADRDGGSVNVLAVVDPVPAYAAAMTEFAVPDIDRERRAATALDVRAQIERVMGEVQWPVTVVVGQIAEAIVTAAKRMRASCVVLGLGRHRMVDRILGGETALHVARHSPVPVLVVPSAAADLPTRAVAAIDFSESSERAAFLAAQLVGSRGVVTLVHAQPFAPDDGPHGDRVAWVRLYTEGAERRLERLRARLERIGGVPHAEARLVTGDPAHAVLDLVHAERFGALAIGMHDDTGMERLLVGSVSTHLMRAAPCAVLVAPPPRRTAT